MISESAGVNESSWFPHIPQPLPKLRLFLARIRDSRSRPLAVAVAAVACSALLRQALDPLAGNNAPLMLFCFGVFVAALYGGFESGIAAILLSIPTADFLFVDPRYEFFADDPKGMLVMLAAFGVTGLGICWVVDRMNHARGEMRRLALDLQTANAKLTQSDERFRMATALANESIWEWDPKQGLGTYTETFIEKFGAPPRASLFEWWEEKIHPDDRRRVSESFLAALNGTATEWKADYRFRTAHGEWAQVLDRARFARGEAGEAVRVIGANLDITDAARARTAVLESEIRLSTLAAMMPEILFTATAAGEIDYVSKRFTDFTGMSSEALSERGWMEFVHPEDRRRAIQIWSEAIASGAECGSLYRLCGSGGEYRWFQCHAAPLRGPDGRPIKWFGVCADVDDRVRMEQELQAQKRELEHANSRLHRFAYAVAHDLKEPLRTVGAFTQMMRARAGRPLDDETKHFMGTILSGVDRMQTLIHDLLEYSRIGEASAEPRVEVDLNEALGKALMNLQFAIAESGAQISFDHLPSTLAHPALAASVFQNLLANGIKYCEERPEVHVGCELRGGEWVISVKDNGIGIDPQYYQTIFEPFRRLHARSKYSGTGIGLASCKEIVEELGGRIWIESAKGAGSTFFFTLPFAESG